MVDPVFAMVDPVFAMVDPVFAMVDPVFAMVARQCNNLVVFSCLHVVTQVSMAILLDVVMILGGIVGDLTSNKIVSGA